MPKGLRGEDFIRRRNGKMYPSVTTVTSLHNRKAIEMWERRVGKEQAEKIKTAAAARRNRLTYISRELS
jgi:hypothetical protein